MVTFNNLYKFCSFLRVCIFHSIFFFIIYNFRVRQITKTDIPVATKSLVNVFILLLKVNIYG